MAKERREQSQTHGEEGNKDNKTFPKCCKL